MKSKTQIPCSVKNMISSAEVSLSAIKLQLAVTDYDADEGEIWDCISSDNIAKAQNNVNEAIGELLALNQRLVEKLINRHIPSGV